MAKYFSKPIFSTKGPCCVPQKNQHTFTLLRTFAYKVKKETTQFTLIACSLLPGLMQTSGALPPPFHCLCWDLNRVALDLLQASAALSHTHGAAWINTLLRKCENEQCSYSLFQIMLLYPSEHANEMENRDVQFLEKKWVISALLKKSQKGMDVTSISENPAVSKSFCRNTWLPSPCFAGSASLAECLYRGHWLLTTCSFLQAKNNSVRLTG